jgi:hypothetical protein
MAAAIFPECENSIAAIVRLKGDQMIDHKLEHILSYTGELAIPPELIGPIPEGIRVNFYSSGGEGRDQGFTGRSGRSAAIG